MLGRIIVFTFLLSVPAFAADECQPTVIAPDIIRNLTSVSERMDIECPNQINVEELCRFVAENLSESNSTVGTRFVYQTRIYRAACVNPQQDSAEVIQAKVQNFWNRYHDSLVCNVPHSIVRNGNILKLAVDSSSTDFINDSVRRWKVNINHVDADNKTVLDFIDEERTKSVGTSRHATLNRYFNIFRSNGAKFKREI